MSLPYEILIRSVDGVYSGAQVLDTSSSVARAVKAEDWPEIVVGINEAALVTAAELAAVKAELEAGKLVLAEHQKISDELASRAEKAMAAGDVAALPAIIADAKVYGEAREKKKLLEEADKLEEQAAEAIKKANELIAKAAEL